MSKGVKSLARLRLGAPVVLLAIAVYFTLTRQGFLVPANLLAVARQYSELGLVAVGMTLVIASGGIDISAGGVAGMAAMLLGVCHAQAGLPIWWAAALAVAAAGAAGALNGWAIAYLGMQPVLVTLATMSLTRGIAYILTSGVSLSSLPLGFVPAPVLVTAVAFAGAAIVLNRSTFGRSVLALGQSEAAADLSGIAVRRIKFGAYLLLGLLSGVAGVMVASRLGTSFADAGQNYEFEAITAVVLGGTSLSGGEGSLLGTLFGVATMAALRHGLSLSGETDVTRTQMLALALIAAVLIDHVRRRFA